MVAVSRSGYITMTTTMMMVVGRLIIAASADIKTGEFFSRSVDSRD